MEVSEYKEEEYSAVDDYDGDITDKVKVSKSKNKITYTVKDKYGNKSSISRKIIYKDEMAPVVKLNGNEIVYVSVGDNYKELGVSVSEFSYHFKVTHLLSYLFLYC